MQGAQCQIARCITKVSSLQSGIYLREMKSDYSPDSCWRVYTIKDTEHSQHIQSAHLQEVASLLNDNTSTQPRFPTVLWVPSSISNEDHLPQSLTPHTDSTAFLGSEEHAPKSGPHVVPTCSKALAHLAVLRDLDLLALRNLGYVEMALRDPQQKKTPGSIRRKPKLEEETTRLHWMQLKHSQL